MRRVRSVAEDSVRNRLTDHASGHIVNMFARYLFMARVQFVSADRIAHPRGAKAAVRQNGAEARKLEQQLKLEFAPVLTP
jgi:hypothetical protein